MFGMRKIANRAAVVGKMVLTVALVGALCAGLPICVNAANASEARDVIVLAGVNVHILDMTTPAVSHGRRGDNSYFRAADGRVLGVMCANDARAVRDRVGVTDAGGNWLPPGNWPTLTGMEWSKWFVAEFNRLRFGGDADSVVSVPQRFTPEWVDAERREVVRLVNVERERAGLPRLEANCDIMYAAQIRARELAIYYAHERPDGSRWRTVFEQAGVVERPNGENIHRAVASAESAMSGWMRSIGHRNNLLNEETTAIGVGFYVDETGRMFWVQVFGR